MIGRFRDRNDRFDGFDKLSDFLLRRGDRNRDLSGVKVSDLHDAWSPEKRGKNKTNQFGFLVKFDRFDNPFASINNVPIGDGGPPCSCLKPNQHS